MKTVFGSSREVAHIWAAGSQTQGRNGTRNIFFEDNTLYSYGYHFPLAFYDRAKNRVICNSNGYSVTTARHKGDTLHAVRGRARFICHIPLRSGQVVSMRDIDLQAGLEYLLKEAIDAASVARRAIANPYKIQTAEITAREFADFKREFKLKGVRIPKGAFLTTVEAAELLAKNEAKKADNDARRDERYKRRRELAEIRRQEEEKKKEEARAAWIAGTGDYYPPSFDWSAPVLLRIKGNTIETSKGARVPLRAGIAAFKAWTAGKLFSGAKIGAYTVDTAGMDYVVIGCHRIERKEANRILAELV